MKKILGMAAAFFFLVHFGFPEVRSLAHLFSPGKTIMDKDGDGLGEKLLLSIIVPDNPTARETALAADIAARANLECLALDFGLVRRVSDIKDFPALPCPILIGANTPWAREALRAHGVRPESLGPNEGFVFVFSQNNQHGIVCIAGSDEALLRTGRAFFLRWPYFWEIWGRETGATYFSLEDDLAKFLSGEAAAVEEIVIREAAYEFPIKPPAADALQALSFSQGQIKNLLVEVHFREAVGREKARQALTALAADHRKGLRTDILSYAGCSRLTFELWSGGAHAEVTLPRVGSTKRLLTPAFKERLAGDASGKEFDLLGLFSTKGFYADQDRDGIPDGLDASVVIPEGAGGAAVADLTTRLMLETAGGAFPIVVLDSEVESRKAIAAPILVGPNSLTQGLLKSGKLKPPVLESQWGLVRVVPKAFGKSSALVFHAPDTAGLNKTLSFFARSFPFFDRYAEGRPQFRDIAAGFEKFLKGEKGAAEAWIMSQLEKSLAEFKGKEMEAFDVQALLPLPNKKFEAALRGRLQAAVRAKALTVGGSTLRTGRMVFEKAKEFPWEVDEAIEAIRMRIRSLGHPVAGHAPLRISLGVSESPRVRRKIRTDIERLLEASGFAGSAVDVLSAYKPGYFWLTETVLANLRGKSLKRLTVRFSEEKADMTRPRRTYPEPSRWVQELYPADEILSRELGIPLDRIEFEMKEPAEPVYEVKAFGDGNELLFEGHFSPRTREIPLFNVLPEWGTAKITCGWLRMELGKDVVADIPLQTDLEKFWAFYQEEVLRPVYAHIMNKTGQEPTFTKQPYFQRLLVEIWASEPDYKLGLDEEIISSLESLHDEIYFDTLDVLRGITNFDPDDKELPQDTSRSSGPGNILPLLHPSLEGGPARAKVTFEDWPGQTPELVLKWREKGRDEQSKKIVFPTLKPKDLRLPGFIYNGREGRVEDLFCEIDFEKEADYLALIDILNAYRELSGKRLVEDPIAVPNLHQATVRLKAQDQEKEEILPIVARPEESMAAAAPPKPEDAIVTTHDIISPAMAQAMVRRLGQYEVVRSYVGGKSYEGRDVPVLEMYLPVAEYVSLPRLVTFKPTLQLTARQHANEVSSTSYVLKFAELVARNRDYQEAVKKMNFVLEPMENPDGAELAYELQRTEPFHSLHAGRYGTLGVDIGAQAGSKPLLPEAAVRTNLYNRWLPDLALNLHGYPSHEWVQSFSNYTPYLFRDYWIPKGWFAYYKALSLPIYEKWKKAGDELMDFIVRELRSDKAVGASNGKFYERYRRWAGRWAPHMDAIELHDGLAVFAKRRGPAENKLTARAQTTVVEETPELMDETATGAWLDVLCTQGLAYLRAHMKYLAQAAFDIVRLEEEGQDRVRIAFVRGRPGAVRGTK